MADNLVEIEKSISTLQDFDFFSQMTRTVDNYLPGWWSPARDVRLANEAVSNPYLAMTVNTITQFLFGIPFRVIPADGSIEVHSALAGIYNNVLQRSFNGPHLEKFIRDILTQDNGGFMFLQGNTPAHMPLASVPTEIIHLSSSRCQRTGDTEFPIIYWYEKSIPIKIHHTRVVNLTESPSAHPDMFGVGTSYISRAFLLCKHLADIAIFEDEMLTGKNFNEVFYASGVKSEDLESAFRKADLESENEQRRAIGKKVFIGMRDPNSKLGRILSRSFPDGYDKRNDIEITLTLLSLAASISPQVLFDSVKSGSTKASANISVQVADRKLLSWYIERILAELQYKFLPESLKIIQYNEDSDTDGTKSKIKLTLNQASETAINAKVSTVRVEREKALARGDFSQSQFDVLELEDGRLPNGLPIRAIFTSETANIKKMLGGFTNPLAATIDDIPLIEELQISTLSIAQNSRTPQLQRDAKVLYYALLWLEKELIRPEIDVVPDEEGDTNQTNNSVDAFAEDATTDSTGQQTNGGDQNQNSL